MSLIFLSPVSWSSFAQRPHKFVEWFHRRTGRPVHWIEPYPTRLPAFNDFSCQGRAQERVGKDVPDWLTLHALKVLPVEPLPGIRLLNDFRWMQLIRSLKSDVSSPVMCVIGKPSQLSLRVLYAVKPAISLYDAMDNFPAFYSGLSQRSMSSTETKVAQKVDLIWVSSTALRERWELVNNNVRFVPNAFDHASLPVSTRGGKSAGRRIFGYVGTIGDWFDWAWVRDLAEARPLDIIRLIGPVFQRPSFKLPSNIELLPPCHHREAIIAMSQFDAGLIPFRKTVLTDSVDPIKYYEYRSLGMAVLSTDFGEMRYRSAERGVFICRSIADISKNATAALECRDSRERCDGFASENSWDARFDSAKLLS